MVNTGSSSLKLSVLSQTGGSGRAATIERGDGHTDVEPMRRFLHRAGRIDAIGHRVVHGATTTPEVWGGYHSATLINANGAMVGRVEQIVDDTVLTAQVHLGGTSDVFGPSEQRRRLVGDTGIEPVTSTVSR